MRAYQRCEWAVADWCRAAGAGPASWGWAVNEDWADGISNQLADGVEPTLLRAVRAAQQCGHDGILVVRPVASAPPGHDAGSIPYLHGLHGRVEDGWLVQPVRVWPTEDRAELARSLGQDPASLELRPGN